MQRWQCPVYNSALYCLIKDELDINVIHFENLLFSIVDFPQKFLKKKN